MTLARESDNDINCSARLWYTLLLSMFAREVCRCWLYDTKLV